MRVVADDAVEHYQNAARFDTIPQVAQSLGPRTPARAPVKRQLEVFSHCRRHLRGCRVPAAAADEGQRICAVLDQLVAHPRLPTRHEIYGLEEIGARPPGALTTRSPEIRYRQVVFRRFTQVQVADRGVGAVRQPVHLRHADPSGPFPLHDPIRSDLDLRGDRLHPKPGAFPCPTQHGGLQRSLHAPSAQRPHLRSLRVVPLIMREAPAIVEIGRGGSHRRNPTASPGAFSPYRLSSVATGSISSSLLAGNRMMCESQAGLDVLGFQFRAASRRSSRRVDQDVGVNEPHSGRARRPDRYCRPP